MEAGKFSKENYLEVSVRINAVEFDYWIFLFCFCYIRKLISLFSNLVEVACYQATAQDAHVES